MSKPSSASSDAAATESSNQRAIKRYPLLSSPRRTNPRAGQRAPVRTSAELRLALAERSQHALVQATAGLRTVIFRAALCGLERGRELFQSTLREERERDRALRERAAKLLSSLLFRLAREVLGELSAQHEQLLAERARRALAEHPQRPVRLELNPADRSAFAAELGKLGAVEIVADERIGMQCARLVFDSYAVELDWEAHLRRIEREIDDEALHTALSSDLGERAP